MKWWMDDYKWRKGWGKAYSLVKTRQEAIEYEHSVKNHWLYYPKWIYYKRRDYILAEEIVELANCEDYNGYIYLNPDQAQLVNEYKENGE